MKVAYISGPMSGLPDYNFPAFYAAEAILHKLGWAVINPARVDDELEIPATIKEIISRGISLLLQLDPKWGGAIILLPRWGDSRGACAEVAVAEWSGLRVMELGEAEMEVSYDRGEKDINIGWTEGSEAGAVRPDPMGLDGQGSEGVRDGGGEVCRSQLGEGVSLGMGGGRVAAPYCAICTGRGNGQGVEPTAPRSRDIPPFGLDALLGC